MDARTIDMVMYGKGLAADPAFQDLLIIIDFIPCTNGCPRGLYFHDTKTIVVPPDEGEPVLLHELGHRFGDFHYGDLSEEFAEYFRMWYEGLRI